MRHCHQANAPLHSHHEQGILRACVGWCLLVLLLLVPSAGYGQQDSQILLKQPRSDTPSPELVETLKRPGDLVLRNSTLDAALFTINELWDVNIIAGKLEGEVNGVFKDAPLKEILDSILLGNGFGYRMVGNSIVVSRIDQLGQVNPFFVSEAIKLTNAKPSELAETARLLSTPQGKVQPIDPARSLIVIDFPERVKMIRELVDSVDAASSTPGMVGPMGKPKALEVSYFHTQYITADDAKQVLSTILGPFGRVETMRNEDRLIIVDFAENISIAERVLAQIDRPRPQVQITALIYDLSLEDIQQLGINWAQAINTRTNGTPGETSVVIANPFSSSASGALFTFSHLGDTFDIGSVIQAIENAGDSRLLANPNVTVMDNEQAQFESVTQIPFQQITQTGEGGQLAATAFKDAGIKLDVTPKIAADGTVELVVRPEFSRLTGFTPGDNQPIIDTRATSTTVRVRNGNTLVIGGMRQRSDVGEAGGIPGIKDFRFVGHLFRSRSTDIRESELVVFITPRIVGYSEPLNCREQLVKDTLDCRLDHIPRAEGCPPFGPCNAPGCQGETLGVENSVPTPAIQIAPEIEMVPGPEIAPTPTDAPAPAPEIAPAEVIPSPQEEEIKMAPSILSIRRIQPPSLQTTAPASQLAIRRITPPTHTGTVQRMATNRLLIQPEQPQQSLIAPPPAKKSQDKPKGKSWRDYLFLR